MIVGIVQARTSSGRLPGKILKPILGQPMLTRQLERLKRALRIDELVVATSDKSEDDAIVRLCQDTATTCYRGSLDDVNDLIAKMQSGEVIHAVMHYPAD